MNNQSFVSSLRRIIWPIEPEENKKFLPMALMMFCILFNYSTLRSIKDGFVVTAIGPEAISFLKTYVVLPSAVITMIVYAKLCNIMSRQNVFYTITSFFLGYLILFAFFLYPNPDLIHPSVETIEKAALNYPNFKWFIRIAGSWSYATFYTIAELWGSVMLSLLFWQFANQITKTQEAKRFYPMFGLLGNFALPAMAFMLHYFLSNDTIFGNQDLKFLPVIIITIILGLIMMFLYWWVNAYVLTDPRYYDQNETKSKKSKAKLSLVESFKLIFSSKYLGLIAILILAYGVSINLVEGVWKSKVRELYPTKELYTIYMAKFQAWQGLAAIIFMVIGGNILRRVSWKTAALFTPVMILITGTIFFSFIFFDKQINLYLAAFVSSSPLVIAVFIGMVQNVLSKATKYSLFDSTKEMAYIPLDDELKSKGKAAVDVIGGRFGKSGGGIIQSSLFFIIPSFTFVEATPYFGTIFFIIVILWIFAVKALSKEYESQLSASN